MSGMDKLRILRGGGHIPSPRPEDDRTGAEMQGNNNDDDDNSNANNSNEKNANNEGDDGSLQTASNESFFDIENIEIASPKNNLHRDQPSEITEKEEEEEEENVPAPKPQGGDLVRVLRGGGAIKTPRKTESDDSEGGSRGMREDDDRPVPLKENNKSNSRENKPKPKRVVSIQGFPTVLRKGSSEGKKSFKETPKGSRRQSGRNTGRNTGRGIVAEHFRRDIDAVDIKLMTVSEKRELELKQASAFLHDAFNGRLKNGLGSTFFSGYWPRLAFGIHAGPYFKMYLKTMAFLFCCIIFIEPPSHHHTDWSPTLTLLSKLLEIMCLIGVSSDFVLRTTYMGKKKLIEKGPLRKLLICESLCWLDVLQALARGPTKVVPRFTRVLRPMIYIIVDKHLMILINLSIRGVRQMLPLIGLLVTIIIAMGLLSTSMLSTQLWDKYVDEHPRGEQGHSYPHWTPFDNFGNSIASLFAMVTVEPYVDFAEPFVWQRGEIAVWYLSFIILSQLVVLNLLVAVQCDVFRKLQISMAESESSKELKTLMLVFHLTKNKQTHTIHLNDFEYMLQSYKPKFTREACKVLFQLLDEGKTAQIDVISFVHLCDILRQEHRIDTNTQAGSGVIRKMSGPGMPPKPQLKRTKSNAYRVRGYRARKHALKYMQTKRYKRMFVLLVLTNTALLALITDDTPKYLAWVVKVADFGFIGVQVLEAALRIRVFSFKVYYNDAWNRFNFKTLIVSCVILALYYPMSVYLKDRLLVRGDIGARVQAVAGAVRCLRIMELSQRMRWYVNLLLKTREVVFEFMLLFFFCFYSYGIVGMEVFNNISDFKDTGSTVLTGCRILTMEGWHELMLEAMIGREQVVRAFAAVYFISLVFVVDIMILSQLMAVLYEMFRIEQITQQKDEAERENAKKGKSLKDRKKSLGEIRTSSLRKRDSFAKGMTTEGVKDANSAKYTGKGGKAKPWRHKYLEQKFDDADHLQKILTKAFKKKTVSVAPKKDEIKKAFEKATKLRSEVSDT